jgi:hypothetical protein
MLDVQDKNILAEIATDLVNKPNRKTDNQEIVDEACKATLEQNYDAAKAAWRKLDQCHTIRVEIKKRPTDSAMK